MRTLNTFILICGILSSLIAQTPLKQLTSTPFVEPMPLQISKVLQTTPNANRLGGSWRPNQLQSINPRHEAIKSLRISTSGSLWIDFNSNHLWTSRLSMKSVLEKIIPIQIQNEPWALDWKLVSENTDEALVQHLRISQTLAGHSIHGQDMVLHIENGQLRDLNGFAWTGTLPEKLPAPVSSNEAIESVKKYLMEKKVSFQNKPQFEGIIHPDDEAILVWYPLNGKLKLTYEVSIHPNMLDHWTVFLDAVSLDVIDAYSEVCSFAPLHLFNLPASSVCGEHNVLPERIERQEMLMPVMDGPSVVTDQDLLGQNRTVNGYLVGSTFYMIDASRPGMFDNTQSVLPNDPVGTIWTIDGQNGSPALPSFELIHVANTNNNWKNLEVSAHYNGGIAYEYFKQTFNRNSINGSGGNIISIINVRDENGNDMDNAFWNGSAMFYGNGNVSYKQLARGLDVAGHEMSHGVVQNTANLEYVGQSGALNESYADIFGAMVDRDDWRMGEDVVNLSAFPSGALRDLSNPNNGGNQLGDPGWQPAHMNEFQNLPNTPQGDNGGVHVNSGIPNKAFFLLATSIGKEKAEQIYYKALKDYLVKSSQFIDMRNAAEKAAADLHGSGSAEVVAVRAAFSGVGIGAGQGDDYEEDIDVNDGDDFILATDETQSDLYWVPPDNPQQFVKMELPAPISLPSFTDDGTACVYVDIDNNMILINFDWSQGLSYQAFYLEPNPQGIWRNIVVSKDGSKIAYTTSNLRNEVFVFDFDGGSEEVFVLFNPTTATGGNITGDVLYPDVMEWDYSGEYLMYDALNRIESAFGDGIEYWDISFLYAWDKIGNDFGPGQIGKLFSTLPENISVGNASFSKNSPYIIAFDFLETFFDQFGQIQTDYRVKAANIETGEINDIYLNTTVGYPNYSRLDNKILFTYNNSGSLLLATIDIQNSNKTLPVPGTDVILIEGAQKGVWFTTGNRDFTSTYEADKDKSNLNIWPQPASDFIKVSGEELLDNSVYSLLDMTGRVVLQGVLSSDQKIQVGKLIPGTYLLQVGRREGTVYNTRFVKQ